MNHFIKKLMPLVLISSLGAVFFTHSMEGDMALESPFGVKFGVNFEPISKIKLPVKNGVLRAVVSPDSKEVLIGEVNNVRLYDIKTGTLLQEFPEHPWLINSLAFSPYGNAILTAGGKIARYCNKTTGSVLHEFTEDSPITAVAFSPDGTTIFIATSDGTARLWDIRKKAFVQDLKLKLAPHQQSLRFVENAVAFSPDGSFLLTSFYDPNSPTNSGHMLLWDLETTTVLHDLVTSGPVDAITFSSDSTLILAGRSYPKPSLWSVSTGEELKEFWGNSGNIFSVAFSPDNKVAITGADYGTVTLWDVETGKELKELKEHTGPVKQIAISPFSPYGQTMHTVYSDGTVITWGNA